MYGVTAEMFTFSALTKGASGWIYLLLLPIILMNISCHLCLYCLCTDIIIHLKEIAAEDDFTLHQVLK